MLLYYIRHGDPIYNPNMLTPLGKRQAEEVAKRLALYGVDEIYASPSNRARQTAVPTSELLKLEIKDADFADELHVWRSLTCPKLVGEGVTWLFQHPEKRALFNSPEVRALGLEWYKHPSFTAYEAGMKWVDEVTDSFLASLGYEHERSMTRYKITSGNEKRIALFAHQGFGFAFLASLLDIAYPSFSTRFDMTHTGVTVIEFKDEGGYSYPAVLTLSNDSHLYKSGLPTKYQNRIYF